MGYTEPILPCMSSPNSARERLVCKCNIYTVHLIRWESHRIHAFFPPVSLPPDAMLPLRASCSFSHDVVSTVNPPAHLHRSQLADSSVPDLTYMLQINIPDPLSQNNPSLESTQNKTRHIQSLLKLTSGTASAQAYTPPHPATGLPPAVDYTSTVAFRVTRISPGRPAGLFGAFPSILCTRR